MDTTLWIFPVPDFFDHSAAQKPTFKRAKLGTWKISFLRKKNRFLRIGGSLGPIFAPLSRTSLLNEDWLSKRAYKFRASVKLQFLGYFMHDLGCRYQEILPTIFKKILSCSVQDPTIFDLLFDPEHALNHQCSTTLANINIFLWSKLDHPHA